jgi:tetratricopeptide (TPR) repeat protein
MKKALLLTTVRVVSFPVMLAAAALIMLALPQETLSQEISRQVRDGALRDVRSMARYGQYDSALERLEWLYAGLPRDEVVVAAFFDYLVDREKYERARNVMENYLAFRPTYIGGMAKLADLYFKMGENDEARVLLARFIETGHSRAWAYEMAAQTYINAGLPEEALAVIRQGRELHENDCMLFDQAARAYMSTGMYAEAVNEYLLAVEGDLLAVDVAGGRIVAVAAEPGAREVIVPVLEQAVEAGVAGLVPLTTLWKLSMADGDCPGGLEEVRRMVEIDPGLVGLLVNAAREFERNECFGECAEAYGLAAGIKGTSEDAQEFLLARGRCQERGNYMDEAIATYADFVTRFPGSRRVFDAYLALARVNRAVGECEEALVGADKAIEARAASKDTRRAVLIKGDCLTVLERFDEAKLTYDLVRPGWDDFQAQTAYYNLGEIAFYEHDFDAALSYFNVAMKEYPGEPLANDAIERIILIRASRSGETYAPELEKFASAALLERQGNTGEAIVLLRATGAAAPPELRTQSLKNLIRVYLAMEDYEHALEICAIATDMMESHWSPVALETAGDIYLGLGMLDDAVRTYEDVIVRFPASVSAGEARRKLDFVRRNEAD